MDPCVDFIAGLHLIISGQLDRSDRMSFTARTEVSLRIAMGRGVTTVTPSVLGYLK